MISIFFSHLVLILVFSICYMYVAKAPIKVIFDHCNSNLFVRLSRSAYDSDIIIFKVINLHFSFFFSALVGNCFEKRKNMNRTLYFYLKKGIYLNIFERAHKEYCNLHRRRQKEVSQRIEGKYEKKKVNGIDGVCKSTVSLLMCLQILHK